MSAAAADVPKPSPRNRDRDRDLLETDDVLDDETLDNLWDWFDRALEDKLDRQLVFVKMVNSMRKQYKQKMQIPMADRESRETTTPRAPPDWTTTPSTTEYAPSEARVMDDDNSDNTSTHTCPAMPPDVVVIPRVVIMGVGGITSRRFVKLNSLPDTCQETTGRKSGTLCVTDTICSKTIFELHGYQDGTFAFKLGGHDELYLRASTSSNPVAGGPSFIGRWFSGTGNVDLVYGRSGNQELFRIHKLSPKSPEVVIESVHLPGKFVRLHQGVSVGTAVINLQDAHGMAERFLLVLSL